jgi:hypothetical protein
MKTSNLLKQILWDTNVSSEDITAVINNKMERVGSYDKKKIFSKCLESYPWFTLLEMFPIQDIKELLSKEIIKGLRSKSLQHKYLFLHEYLQRTV